MLGKYVRVKVVRPIGAKHPRFPFTYRLNYGFAQGVTGISGEAQGRLYHGESTIRYGSLTAG